MCELPIWTREPGEWTRVTILSSWELLAVEVSGCERDTAGVPRGQEEREAAQDVGREARPGLQVPQALGSLLRHANAVGNHPASLARGRQK